MDDIVIGDARSRFVGANALRLLVAPKPCDVKAFPLEPRQPKLLKDSEKKKWREKLRRFFSPALDDDASLAALLPDKLSIAKLGKSRHEVLRSGAAVLIAEDSGSLVPTVWALRHCPQMLRQLAVHAPVCRAILRGAELFAPGVIGASTVTGGASWARDLCGGPFDKGHLVALVTADSWAPFAVGRFTKSDDALVEDGLRGELVKVIMRAGDALNENLPAPSADPPPDQLAALERLVAQRADDVARIDALNADRAAAEAAVAAANAVADLHREKRRLEKALRAVAALKDAASLNLDQQDKLDREDSMKANLASVVAQLDALEAARDVAPSEPAPRESPQDALLDAGQDDPQMEAASPEDEMPDGDEGEQEEDDDPDQVFRDAFLTVLSGLFAAKSKTPTLVAEVVAAAAKLASRSVKETRWKKAAKFLRDELETCVITRERAEGVTEIVDVDWSCAPAFEPVVALPDDASVAAPALKRATKKGGRVTVSVRRVRNKNCTFIDGLDSWGFSETDMRGLAAAFRSRFSAAASVAPRKGTEASDRRFFSIMVQGKYADQIASTLRADLRVGNVHVAAAKGLLTKHDRAANV